MLQIWQCSRVVISRTIPSACFHRTSKHALATRWLSTSNPCGIEHVASPSNGSNRSRGNDSGHLQDYSKSLASKARGHDWSALGPLSGDGATITLNGYIGTRKKMSKSLVFQNLFSPDLKRKIQLVCLAKPGSDGVSAFPDVATGSRHSPVQIRGTLRQIRGSNDNDVVCADSLQHLEVEVAESTVLNTFPQSVMLTEDKIYRPDERHLEIRAKKEVREALLVRSEAASIVRQTFLSHDFVEIETPILFKSTPEGAREFLVPTRQRNRAYALPQSPQQYKQILMASGIPRYFQIARCFRDEDLRIDRQPEFTQIDYELAFADESAVKEITETLISRLWSRFHPECDIKPGSIKSITYNDAMAKYGTDKPDRRFGMQIVDLTHLVQTSSYSEVGHRVEMLTFDPKANYADPMNDPVHGAAYNQHVQHIQAGIYKSFGPQVNPEVSNLEFFQYNSTRGDDILSKIVDRSTLQSLGIKDNDYVVILSETAAPRTGGWTTMGRIRDHLHRDLVEHGLALAPTGFDFLWVVDFPLFSPSTDSEPGQGGEAGLSSTHHPFTAPKTQADLGLLLKNPLSAVAAHYDLVVNGVELGGGSRRIHNGHLQEYILRSVLQVPEAGIASLQHLIDALKGGCPPHAGMALGFDRLLAVLLGRASVKDVIAFPKNNRGEDLLVGSPNTIRPEQLKPYHLSIIEQEDITRESKALKDHSNNEEGFFRNLA